MRRKVQAQPQKSGKKRSALNGTRHGLTGQVVVLPEEDFAAFNAFMTALVATFDVAGAMEQQLAQSFANYQWRINRAAAIEENMFALGNMVDAAGNLQLDEPQVHNAMCNAKMFRSDSAEFGRIAMYTQRLVNQAEKVLKQLKQLQRRRPATAGNRRLPRGKGPRARSPDDRGGLRIDPASLPAHDGLEIRPYVHELYRHLAACDLAVVQGGLTTTMELTASRRPFLYFPLRHHFEQNLHVRHRLDRYRAGQCMDYQTAEPADIAAAITSEIGREVDYRPVATDGAARAAALLANLL